MSGLGLLFQSLVLADTPTCDPEKFLPVTFSGAVFFHSGEAMVQPKTSKQFQPLLLNYVSCVLLADKPVEKSLPLSYCAVLVKFLNFSELPLFPSTVFPLREVVRVGIIDVRHLANSRSSVNGHLRVSLQSSLLSLLLSISSSSLPNLSSRTGGYLTFPV